MNILEKCRSDGKQNSNCVQQIELFPVMKWDPPNTQSTAFIYIVCGF